MFFQWQYNHRIRKILNLKTAGIDVYFRCLIVTELRMKHFSYKKRVIRILELLSSGRAVSTALLDREFEGQVSRRTLQRDLQEIAEILPVEIVQEKGREQAYSMPRYYKDLIRPIIQQNELLALHTLKGFLRNLRGTRLDRDLKKLEQKLEQMLPGEVILDMERLSDLAVYDQNRGYFDYEAYDRILSVLISAMTDKQWLRLHYKPIDKEKESEMLLFPHRLYSYNGALYVLGTVYSYSEPISLLIQFISGIEMAGAGKRPVPEFSLENFKLSRFGVYNGPVQRVVLEISAGIKRHFWGRIWHESQSITELEDGRMRIELEVPIMPDFVAWVLSWGSSVRVVEPAELIERVRGELLGALGNMTADEGRGHG